MGGVPESFVAGPVLATVRLGEGGIETVVGISERQLVRDHERSIRETLILGLNHNRGKHRSPSRLRLRERQIAIPQTPE